MSISGNFTLFQTAGSGSGGGTDFEKAAFKDITKAPTNNGSYNSTASTNPTDGVYADNSQYVFGTTRLLIKDIVLEKDKFKWVGGRPTWKVLFNQNFQCVEAYVTGMPQIKTGPNGSYLALQKNDVFGVCGLANNVHFLVKPDWNGTNKYDFYLDGAFTTSFTIPQIQVSTSQELASMVLNQPYLPIGPNTNTLGMDIHDFRMVVLDVSDGLSAGIYGVEVSSETARLRVFEGSTFVDKSLVTQVGAVGINPTGYTTATATGGAQISAAIANGGVTFPITDYFATLSIGAGASGTNTIGVTTGTGSYFSVNQHVFVPYIGGTVATNFYYGVVTNVSTDTLTVSPTLYIGFSGQNIIPLTKTGPSFAISSSLYVAKDPSDPWSEKQYECNLSYSGIVGFSGYASQRNIFLPGVTNNVGMVWEGYAEALDMTVVANQETPQKADYLIEVDNYPAGSYQNATLMHAEKVNLFSNAPPGWHKVVIYPGTSLAGTSKISITDFTSYVRRPIYATFGALGHCEKLPDAALFGTLVINNTSGGARVNNGGLGLYQRLGAADVAWPVGWTMVRENSLYIDHVSVGGYTTGLAFTLSFYGCGFAAGVQASSNNVTCFIDGVAIAKATYVSLGPDSWHTFHMIQNSQTFVSIESFDIYRNFSPVVNSEKIYFENNIDPEPMDNSPIGTVVMFAGLSAPRGWLFCDGQLLSKSRFPKLAKAIAQSFGTNDNQKNLFRLPDTRGLFVRALDNMQTIKGAGNNDPDTATRTVYSAGGNAAGGQGSYQDDTVKAHDHTTHASGTIAPSGRYLTVSPAGNYSGGGGDSFGGGNLDNSMRTSTNGSTDGKPRNTYLNMIIKAE